MFRHVLMHYTKRKIIEGKGFQKKESLVLECFNIDQKIGELILYKLSNFFFLYTKNLR